MSKTIDMALDDLAATVRDLSAAVEGLRILTRNEGEVGRLAFLKGCLLAIDIGTRIGEELTALDHAHEAKTDEKPKS